jgi:iron complex outermembrane recepter protein
VKALLFLAGVSALAISTAEAQQANANDEIIVTGAVARDVPTTHESVDAEKIARTINVVTPEDTLRYTPNLLVRQRHIGDTQSPVTTRTSGVGASARSLIYVDGILISSLIGNNNTSASPKWGLVTPDAIDRVDVLYGPFAAAYAGNSIGAVIAFTTRMPDRLEANLGVQGARQSFSKYGDDDDYNTWRVAGDIGDRAGRFAYRLSYNHLDTFAQPLTYATAVTPGATSAAGAPVTGAFNDANRLGQPIVVLGSTGLEHQVQDNFSGRATYDLTPQLTAAYTFGLFLNKDDSTVNTYLRNAAGQPVYAGAVNIGGRAYTIANSTFSNGVYRLDERQLAQAVSLTSHTNGALDFELVGSWFDILESRQRTPSTALPAAFTGGAGSVASLDDTGWYTADANATWRPLGPDGAHIVTFGAHLDRFTLSNPRYALGDWIGGADGALQTLSKGRTQTQALWAQEAWAFAPQWKATLGARYEHWRAFDGVNFSAAPALNVSQPEISHDAVSPKATLAFAPGEGWALKASLGVANRFPTVTELYQSVTVGAQLQTPNPYLKPERALSSELSAERMWDRGRVRVSLFDERIKNTLLSQTALLPSGASASFVQNIDRTHATGIELVASRKDVLISGLELSGWVTYVDAKIDEDAAFPAAVGKRLTQIPHWRGSFVASYAATPKLDLTLAGRYSDRTFATIDNSDSYANTYQGFGAYFVADAKARYRLTDHLTASIGVNNLVGRSYFLFHPFPQRSVLVDLKYSY